MKTHFNIQLLEKYLESKYQFEMNSEEIRQSILLDIEKWFMNNVNRDKYVYDLSYKKYVREEIEYTKHIYYDILIYQK